MISTVQAVLRSRRTRAGRQRKIPRPPKQPRGKGIEREYVAALEKLIAPAKALIDKLLLPQLERISRMAGVGMRRDVDRLDVEPWADIVSAIMAEVRKQYEAAEAKQIENVVSKFGGQTDSFNAAAVRKQLASMLGVDLWQEVPEIGPMLQSWATENVALIKSIPEKYFGEVEGMVLRDFRAGVRAEDLAPQLAQRFEVSTSRGMLIARDQIAKLNGDLTRQRQTGLGINKYRWRTSLDERVRARHAELEGRVFDWDNPPIVDTRTGRRAHPGGDYQCRCTAEPVVDDLLD